MVMSLAPVVAPGSIVTFTVIVAPSSDTVTVLVEMSGFSKTTSAPSWNPSPVIVISTTSPGAGVLFPSGVSTVSTVIGVSVTIRAASITASPSSGLIIVISTGPIAAPTPTLMLTTIVVSSINSISVVVI